MRFNKYILVSFLLILGINAKELKWHSFDEGYSLAKKENKIILIDLYTDWCGWCKKMDKETYSNTNIINQLNKDFVAIKLNPEKTGNVTLPSGEMTYRQFASQLGVNSYPSTAFFTSDLKLIEVIPGYFEPNDMKMLLGFMKDGSYEKISFQDYRLFEELKIMEAEAPNSKLDYLLGYFYLMYFNDSEQAHSKFKKALESGMNQKELFAALSFSSPKQPSNSDDWMNLAKSLGFKQKSELGDLAVKFVREIYSKRQ